MKVGVVGGGVLGLSLAYYLSRSGAKVTLFEGKDRAGGLLDYVQVDGFWIDKYYHCILSNYVDLLDLVDEIGLRDRVRFTNTKQGVYADGNLYSLGSAKDFLLFPLLSPLERVRLAISILRALRVDDWHELEEVGVEEWLVRLGGRGVFEKLWKPMLRAKFDGAHAQTPATYIWSRLKRTSTTRASAGPQERMGYFVGSYKQLVDRLVDRIEAAGSTVRLGAKVQEIAVSGDRVDGVVVDDAHVPLDTVVVTTPLPILQRLLPEPWRGRLDVPAETEYLGVVCGLLLLDRPLSSYYTLNIADESIPFTAIIETTNLIAPEHVGGYHLAYLPKYVTPASPYARLSDGELFGLYRTYLKKMFPNFDERWIKHQFVFRERFVEPLHRVRTRRPVMPIRTQLGGLYVVNNGQIYPDLTSCQSGVRHAREALPILLAGTSATRREPATVG
ncbi:MAG TPA: FAD-dependent oxidoreductase [Chloroflexota bacterium]|nr:FAD-dependent oxidoreductase [Chloroflexota bacterium]